MKLINSIERWTVYHNAFANLIMWSSWVTEFYGNYRIIELYFLFIDLRFKCSSKLAVYCIFNATVTCWWLSATWSWPSACRVHERGSMYPANHQISLHVSDLCNPLVVYFFQIILKIACSSSLSLCTHPPNLNLLKNFSGYWALHKALNVSQSSSPHLLIQNCFPLLYDTSTLGKSVMSQLPHGACFLLWFTSCSGLPILRTKDYFILYTFSANSDS